MTESLDKNENIYNLDMIEDGANKLNSRINEITNQIDNMIVCIVKPVFVAK